MSNEKAATFIGHSECYGIDRSRVHHGWGDAAKTLERAQKKGLTIVNLGSKVQ